MSTTWRIAWDDEGLAASEPLPLETLRRLAASGKVSPQTLARPDDDPEWRAISAIPELYGALFGGLFDDLFGDADQGAGKPTAHAAAGTAPGVPAAPPSPAQADPSATPPGEYAFDDDIWGETLQAQPRATGGAALPPPGVAAAKTPAYAGPPPSTSQALGGAMSALGGTLEKKARQAKLYAQIMKIESMDKAAATERLGKAVAALPTPIRGGDGFLKDIDLIERKAAEQDAQAKGFFGLKAKGTAAALRRRLPDLYLRLADLYLSNRLNAPQSPAVAAELAALDDCARRVAELQSEMDALKGEMKGQSEVNREARGRAAAYFKNIGKPEPKKDDEA